MCRWRLVVFKDGKKDEIMKVYDVDSIKQIAYLLDETSIDISNFYHKLIKGKNKMKLVNIIKI
tara:strand:+ start:395 stop:583 length:189 start_codon:yes stop_codon:yes gene_type:complete